MNKIAKRTLIIGAGISVVGAVIYFLFRESSNKVGQTIRAFKSNGEDTNDSDDNKKTPDKKTPDKSTEVKKTPCTVKNAQTKTGCRCYVKESIPLSLCMEGTKIKNLQKYFNDVRKTNLTVDGKLGPLTMFEIMRPRGAFSMETSQIIGGFHKGLFYKG